MAIIASTLTISAPADARGVNGVANPYGNPIKQLDTGPYDVSYAYNEAKVFVPGAWFTKSIDDVSLNGKYPVVVYLHGSGGIYEHSHNWANFLSKNGYVVVMLDSFAIPGRERNTPNSSQLAGNNYNRSLGKLKISGIRLRKGETHYALEKLRSLPWVDTGAIFLMGHSEGGGSAARVAVKGLAGVIWSGYKCVGRSPIQVREDIPVLALNHETDVWFTKEGHPHCSRLPEFTDRVWHKEVVLPGEGHRTAEEERARDAVLSFLNQFK